MTVINHLNGQFSGPWVCELCGHSGSECRCEHFQRGGNVWGHWGTVFSDSELAAEYWRLVIAYYRTGLVDYKEQAETIRRFAENPSYEETE